MAFLTTLSKFDDEHNIISRTVNTQETLKQALKDGFVYGLPVEEPVEEPVDPKPIEEPVEEPVDPKPLITPEDTNESSTEDDNSLEGTVEPADIIEEPVPESKPHTTKRTRSTRNK